MDQVAARMIREILGGLSRAGTMGVESSTIPKVLKNVLCNSIHGVEDALDEALLGNVVQQKFEQMTAEPGRLIKVETVAEDEPKAMSETNELIKTGSGFSA